MVPTLIDTKVNNSMKDNENKMTLKFNTFLVLMKEIEYVVKNTTKNSRNVYHLHKPSEKPIEIKDDDDDNDDGDQGDKYDDGDDDDSHDYDMDEEDDQ